MLLRSVRVVGFRSFRDSGTIKFQDGMNLIVGPNNVGKSAFLRSLQPPLDDQRHRTPSEWRLNALEIPKVIAEFDLAGSEIVEHLKSFGGEVMIPVTRTGNYEEFIDSMIKSENLKFDIEYQSNKSFISEYPSHKLFAKPGDGMFQTVSMTYADGAISLHRRGGQADNIPQFIEAMWKSSTYFFSAERYNIGETETRHTERLDERASNLAAVISTISGNSGDIFDRLVSHLRDIFPTVGNISTRVLPDNPNRTEIRVWPTHSRSNVDLSFPLAQSGTGVGQVMALLVAVMSSSKSTIIIDEINSFLHPSAVKSLLRILQTNYSGHQYIISAHAPEVISYAGANSIHLVRRHEYNSEIIELNPKSISTFRSLSTSLGVSMADVFAADRVVWVEGQTEEKVFPYIYREIFGEISNGTIFTTVSATSDFGAKRRDRELVYEVYNRLSASIATLPVSVSFGFDAEQLTADEKTKMMRDAGGRLLFLPRRHLECYFINPEALAHRIREKDVGSTITAEIVTQEILKIASEREFSIKDCPANIHDEIWISQVNAAKILSKLFSNLTNFRIEYDKVIDGIEIVKYLICHNPDQIQELSEYIKKLVELSEARS